MIYSCIRTCVYLFFYINRIQYTHTQYTRSQQHTSPMAKSRKNRSSRSRSRSRSKYQKGGWGGWPRTTHVGPSWTGTNGSNHFALSKAGVPSGHPMSVSAFGGPGMHQANRLVPHLAPNALSKGGSKRANKSRSRRGGFTFGGFPQDLKLGWDNLKIGAQNVYRGIMGTNQLNSASPWNQPALNANQNQHVQRPQNIAAIRAAAHARVAKIH